MLWDALLRMHVLSDGVEFAGQRYLRHVSTECGVRLQPLQRHTHPDSASWR